MSEKKRVLVVEDEKAIRLGLEENLKFAGFETLVAEDGPTALKMGTSMKPDLILLDVMLPGLSGYEVCRRLREGGAHMPIIMLTARQEEFDKLHGFESGADDYVTKPFSVKELLARVRAVLARGRVREDEVSEFEFDECRLDSRARILTCKGREITMTRTEFDLLAYFCRHAGQALSREVVMNEVWGTEYYGTQRSLDSFVSTLRSKIERDPHKPRHILTVHGVGYKFMA